MKNFRRKLPAFNLTELLVVLAIVGILLLLALPNLLPLVTQAKTTEAKIQLKHLYTLQKNYFYIHSEYTDDFNELNYEQSKLVTDGGTANYKIEIIEAGPSKFKASATSVKDFDQDGIFNMWEIDHEQTLKEVTKD